MLDVRIPYKALDERMGRNEIEFKALAVYFYSNLGTKWKPHYIVQVPLDLRNRDWRLPPTKTDPRYNSLIKQGQDNYHDAFYDIEGPKARIRFIETQPHTPSYEEDKEWWLNHKNFTLHSHYESLDNTLEKIHLPFKLFNFIEEWDGERYRMNLEKIVK